MKVSTLITALQGMQDVYGDLQVTITIDFNIGTKDPKVMTSEDLYLGYDQMDDHDEINIRNFPY